MYCHCISSVTNTCDGVSSSCIWYSHKQLVRMVSGFSWDTVNLDLAFEKDSTPKDKKQNFSSKTFPVMPVDSPEAHCPGQGNWDAPMAHKPTTPTETMMLHNLQHPLLAPQQWNKYFCICMKNKWMLYTQNYVHASNFKTRCRFRHFFTYNSQSHCLPRSFLAPFKIHQDLRVPPGKAALGKAKREETHWP